MAQTYKVMMTDILVIEDNEELGKLISDFLKREGYSVMWEQSAEKGLDLLGKAAFKMLLLDVMLPGMDGYEALQEIRKNQKLPVMMMSARTDEQSKVLGFEVGADDYIAKPFRPRELVSRIKNVLRLTGSTGSVTQLGDVLVDTVKGTASKNGRDLFLSALEYRLLLVYQ